MATKVSLDNIIVLDDGTVMCPFSRNKWTEDKYFIIDKKHLYKVVDKCWFVNENFGPNSKSYTIKSSIGGKLKSLHRVLHAPNADRSIIVDHINKERWFDNSTNNTRICNHQQNMMNRRASHKFKGVSFHNNAWYAYIKYNRKLIYLGRFRTAEEAAKTYDKAAQQYFKEFALLNFPN